MCCSVREIQPSATLLLLFYDFYWNCISIVGNANTNIPNEIKVCKQLYRNNFYLFIKAPLSFARVRCGNFYGVKNAS